MRHGCLPTLASLLSERYGVSVVLGGDTAYTDGSTIVLPSLPESPRTACLVRGYIDHESAHIRYTDFTVSGDTPDHHTMLNLLEDLRVERLMGEQFVGARQNLRLLAELLDAEGQFRYEATRPISVLFCYVLATGRVALGQSLQQLQQQVRELLEQTDWFAADRIDPLCARSMVLGSTAEAAALARDFLAELPEHSTQSYEPPVIDGAQEGEAQGESTTETESPFDSTPYDLGGLTAALLGQEHGASGSAVQVRLPRPVTIETRSIDLAEDRRLSTRLRGRLRSLLQSVRLSDHCSGCRGSIPEHRVLYRALVGDTRLFQKRTLARAPNTAVMLLVDRSGSMRYERLDMASRSAALVAEVLEQEQGCRVAVTAFPGGSLHEVVPVLRFGEPVANSRFGMDADGGTPLAEALYYAGVQLLTQPEQRRILMVMTDGEPDCCDSTRQALRWLEERGVEPCAIGIMDSTVESLFRTQVVIMALEELPRAVIRLLGDVFQVRRMQYHR